MPCIIKRICILLIYLFVCRTVLLNWQEVADRWIHFFFCPLNRSSNKISRRNIAVIVSKWKWKKKNKSAMLLSVIWIICGGPMSCLYLQREVFLGTNEFIYERAWFHTHSTDLLSWPHTNTKSHRKSQEWEWASEWMIKYESDGATFADILTLIHTRNGILICSYHFEIVCCCRGCRQSQMCIYFYLFHIYIY